MLVRIGVLHTGVLPEPDPTSEKIQDATRMSILLELLYFVVAGLNNTVRRIYNKILYTYLQHCVKWVVAAFVMVCHHDIHNVVGRICRWKMRRKSSKIWKKICKESTPAISYLLDCRQYS
jgi:hypothetical protein